MTAKTTAKTPAAAKKPAIATQKATAKAAVAEIAKDLGSKKPAAKPVVLAPMPGSKKAKVYDRFAKDGRDAAFAYGRKSLHCTEGTLKTWMGAWARSQVKPRPMAAAA